MYNFKFKVINSNMRKKEDSIPEKKIKNFVGLGVERGPGNAHVTSVRPSLTSTPLRGIQKFIRSFFETSNKFLKSPQGGGRA